MVVMCNGFQNTVGHVTWSRMNPICNKESRWGLTWVLEEDRGEERAMWLVRLCPLKRSIGQVVNNGRTQMRALPMRVQMALLMFIIKYKEKSRDCTM